MSIILAGTVSNAHAAHPLFTQRGLLGMTHARLDQLGLFGRPFSRELAYDGYTRNIDVFIAATNHKAKISTNVDAAELFMEKIEHIIPLSSPRVAISPVKKLSSDQVDVMMAKLVDEEPSKEVKGSMTFIVLAKPNPKKAMIYTRISAENVQVPEHTWSPATYASYCFCLAVVTEFLKTNTYPAFISETQIQETTDFADFVSDIDTVTCSDVNEYPVKRTKWKAQENGDQMEVDDEEVPSEVYVFSWKELRGAVLVAKPSPIPLVYNVGSPAEVPELPGRCFPYFDRMNIPDATTIRSVMSAYFLRNMGGTREEQMNTFKFFKKGWEILVKTDVGAAMAHILTGVRLALETQTRLFIVIRSDQYAGFVLLGARWSISLHNQVYVAQSAEELRAEVNKMSSHSYAIAKIAQELSPCMMRIGAAQGPPKAIVAADLPSAISLWKAIQERVIEKEARERITEVLGLVAYTRSYKQVDARSLSWMFAELAKDTIPDLPEGTPLYVPATFELFHEKSFQLLCTFGPNAPSLYNSSGTVFKIPASADKDPNNEMVEGKKRAKLLPYLLVALKSVKAAHDDLIKVMRDKQIRIDLAERAGKNRNVLIGGEGRDLLYEEIRKCVHATVTGSKRKAGEVVGSSPKRSRFESITSADDLLALL